MTATPMLAPSSNTSRWRHGAAGLRRRLPVGRLVIQRVGDGRVTVAISRASAGAAPPNPIAGRLAGARSSGPPELAALASVDPAAFDRFGEGDPDAVLDLWHQRRVGQHLEDAADERRGSSAPETGFLENGGDHELRGVDRSEADEQRGV